MPSGKSLAIVSLALLTSGCVEYWARPGATPADLNYAMASCQAQAHAQFPPALQPVQTGGGYTTERTTKCQGSGNSMTCRTTGGDYIPPSYSTVDLNDGGRDSAFHACMFAGGWQAVDSREQAAAIMNSYPPPAMATQPRLAPAPNRRQ